MPGFAVHGKGSSGLSIAAVSSLEWQFPHDDYKPRDRPAAEAAQRPAGAAAASASAVVHITRPEESPLAKLQLSKGPPMLSIIPQTA